VQFDYTRYDSSRLRPLVDVVVSHGERDASYVLLVDSGADINVFSAELARELGIKLEDGEMLEVRGATGDEATFWRHPVAIVVGGHEVLVLAAFGEAERHSDRLKARRWPARRSAAVRPAASGNATPGMSSGPPRPAAAGLPMPE
jgi:hypothetical protein